MTWVLYKGCVSVIEPHHSRQIGRMLIVGAEVGDSRCGIAIVASNRVEDAFTRDNTAG